MVALNTKIPSKRVMVSRKPIENIKNTTINNISFNGVCQERLSKKLTHFLVNLNDSKKIPSVIKSWVTYMIANVPLVSNAIFKTPIGEGDMIFSVTAALPIVRTMSEVPERKREAFLRDMSGFILFLTCLRAVQGFAWENPFKHLKKLEGIFPGAKGFLNKPEAYTKLSNQDLYKVLDKTMRTFPQTKDFFKEISYIDKIDDLLSTSTRSDHLKKLLKDQGELGIAKSNEISKLLNNLNGLRGYLDDFLSQYAKLSKKVPYKEIYKNMADINHFRSVSGAVVGGLTYLLVSGVGINKLNQRLERNKKEEEYQNQVKMQEQQLIQSQTGFLLDNLSSTDKQFFSKVLDNSKSFS